MKRLIFKILLILFIIPLYYSCHNTGLIYDADQKGTLYFKVGSTDVKSFVFELEDYMECDIDLYLMGMPRSFDRSFDIEFINDTTKKWDVGSLSYEVLNSEKGVHFEHSELILPADSIHMKIKFTLNRTADIENKYVSVFFRIRENEHFIPMHENNYRFFITDGDVTLPDWWNNGVFTDMRIEGWQMYIGKFYPEKFRRMLQYYWDLEELSPLFYEEALEIYGKYLDKPDISAGFYQKHYPALWAKYVLIPLYEYYVENPIPGDSPFAETGNQGEYWRNPVALYR